MESRPSFSQLLYPVTRPILDRIEGLSQPDSAQLLMISDFLGEQAIHYLLNKGGRFKVHAGTFGNNELVPDLNSCIEYTSFNFFCNYLGKMVTFEGDVTSYYHDKEPVKEYLEHRDKSLILSFGLEEDFDVLWLLHKIAAWNEKNNGSPRFQFLQQFTENAVSRLDTKQAQRNPGKGLRPDGFTFLRTMEKFVKIIDPECDIALYPADKQRERIYKRAFQNCENIFVDSAVNSHETVDDLQMEFNEY